MIMDAQQIFSDAQAVTAVGNTDSTNILNLGAAGNAYEEQWLVVQVETAFASAGAATLQVNVLTDSTSAFSSAVTLLSTAAIALATLVDGYNILKVRLPQGAKQYVKLQYGVGTAAFTAGKIDAFLTPDVQTNRG